MTALPDSALGISFSLNLLPGLVFTRYPITVDAPEGTTGACNGEDWQRAGIFQNGMWCGIRGKPFKRVPTHWTISEDIARKPDDTSKDA